MLNIIQFFNTLYYLAMFYSPVFWALIIVSAKADLSFPNVSIGNPVMCYIQT